MNTVASRADSLRAPLRVPAYRRALVGRTLSGIGSWMQVVAAGWLVYDLTGNAAAVGLLTLLARGPGIPLSALGGALAERVGARRLELWLAVVQLVATALLAASTLDGDVGTAEVYACTGVIGVCSALGTAGMQALVTAVVGPELRKPATSLGSLSYNASRLIGPALGGALLSVSGPGLCFAVNAASYLAILVAIGGLPRQAAVRGGASLREGIATLRHAPGAGELVVLVAAFMTLVTPLQELAPVIARRHGEDGHLLGFLVAALAAGGIVGAWVRQRIDRRQPAVERVLASVVGASGAAVATIALTGEYVVAIAAMFLAGVLWEVLFVEGLGAAQDRSAGHEALAAGVFFALALAGVTAGTLAIGAAIQALGLTETLLVCAVVLAGVGAARLAVTPAGRGGG